MMLDEMIADPMPDEVRAMLTDVPTYKEIAECACNNMAEAYPTVKDISELENIPDEDGFELVVDCLGEDFKKLMEEAAEGMQ